MVNSLQIIPAILAATEQEYQEKISKINDTPELVEGWVQIDVMDGQFVNNSSISPEVIARYPTSLAKEAHLMVQNPLGWVNKMAEAGVSRIVFPIEVGSTKQIISLIKSLGMEVGLSLNPETAVSSLAPFADKINLVLLMAVHPGFGGQEFLAETFIKVTQAVELKEKYGFLVEVDGGIDEKIAATLKDLGVDNLVLGERLTNGDISENLEVFWQHLR